MASSRHRGLSRVLGAALATILGTSAIAAERPAFKTLRHEEDWSALRDPARRTQPLDALKAMPLGGDSYLSLGGEIRQRYEYTRNPFFGEDPQDRRGVWLQRYALHGDLHLGPNLRVFGQLLSALESGRAGPPNSFDENELDLQQAFVDLRWPLGAGADLLLRGGRQELRYGSARLIDVREGPNVRRKFDGGRSIVAGGSWRVDAFAVRPAELDTGVFDDQTDETQSLWGVYAVRGAGGGLPTGFDLYYLGYDNDRGRFDQGTAGERRHTVGTRLWGTAGGWDWNWEFIYQWGRFGPGDIRAWSAASETGYRLADLPWRPRIAFGADIASGDRDSRDADLETFNPLFPRGNYFSELALLGPRNFVDVHPKLALSPRADVTLTADWNFFWRLERSDGVYTPGGRLIRSGAGSDARFVGHALSLSAEWEIRPGLTLTGIFAHFFPGRFLEETGPSKDVDFVEVTLKVLF